MRIENSEGGMSIAEWGKWRKEMYFLIPKFRFHNLSLRIWIKHSAFNIPHSHSSIRTLILPSGIYYVNDLPAFGRPHQLKHVNAAMMKFIA